MKTVTHSSRPVASGFSLLEMLTTVAILGIMTSLALAWFGGSGQDVQIARDQRNAQSICSLCQVAEAAGLNLVKEVSSPLELARRVSEGITIETGVMRGRTFQVPGMGEEELQGAVRFLKLQNGQLRYDVGSGASRDSAGASEI